jgi:hypothetical protein
MWGPKIIFTPPNPLTFPVEGRLRTFAGAHPPATVAFVRSVDGEVAVIETATPQQAEKVAVALASSDLSAEPLAAVLDSTPEGRDLERLYVELKQRELENQWTNRQW